MIMNKRFRSFLLLFTTVFTFISAQQIRPFEGHYYCKETGVNMYLNLYEETLEAPGFSFLGKMNGYMKDGIYGTWMITKCTIKRTRPLFALVTILVRTHKTLSLRLTTIALIVTTLLVAMPLNAL